MTRSSRNMKLRKATYVIPEKRDIEQITYPDEAAAKAAAAKIAAGESFADAAKDRKLSDKDIALGTLVQADLADARGKAAFSLPEGGVSQPVKFTFGWVLLHVTKITPGVTKTLDDVKEDLRKDLAAQLAQAKIVDVLNAFEDARGGGAPLDKAGKAVGMKVTQVAAVDPNGLAPDGSHADVPDDSDFLKQVFAADVGEEGDAFAVKDGHNYVLKVDGVTPPKLKPLDTVRAAVAAAWQKEQSRQKVGGAGEGLDREGQYGKIAGRCCGRTRRQAGSKRPASARPAEPGLLRRSVDQAVWREGRRIRLWPHGRRQGLCDRARDRRVSSAAADRRPHLRKRRGPARTADRQTTWRPAIPSPRARRKA